MHKTQVIAVDLDGTLTYTDTLFESVLSLIRTKPYFLIILPIWLLRGIAFFKQKIAEYSAIDVTKLPYNLSLIDWLKKEKQNGKKIILSTAANENIAKAVVNHFGFFDEYIASDANINLKSILKRNVLQEKYGNKGYDYAGNSMADIEVWSGGSNAIVVNAREGVLKKASKVANVSRIFSSNSAGILDWVRALRVHQWLKNLLLFVPLLAAHQFSNTQSLSLLIVAFISFSLCASSVYITNDLLDLDSDRNHPRKKNRPFASAKLPIIYGLALLPLLIGVSIALGATINSYFLIALLLYLILTVAYSLVLKRLAIMDCLTLAALYTFRIIAGAFAVSVPLSFWLLAFSIFIFLSLALVKRFAELMVLSQEGKSAAHGRGYLVSDASLLQTLGVSSGYISVLFITMYLNSEEVVSLYSEPLAIWLLIPIILFWVSWVWLKSARGEMHDDPIIFAVKDKVSLSLFAIMTIVFVYASSGIKF